MVCYSRLNTGHTFTAGTLALCFFFMYLIIKYHLCLQRFRNNNVSITLSQGDYMLSFPIPKHMLVNS